MRIALNPKMHSILAACLGAAVTYSATHVVTDESSSNRQITKLENRIRDLERALAEKGGALNDSQFVNVDSSDTIAAIANKLGITVNTGEQSGRDAQTATAVEGVDQILKDLATLADEDPRSLTEKLNDFLSKNPGKNGVAIVSKSVFDLAENAQVLPTQSLESIYAAQQDRDLRRVVAQVASMRGDNRLLELQITEVQSGLKSTQVSERQKALVELAKTHYAGAANMVVPLLQDDDIGVKLDALLALRATGNQSHLHYVAHLVNHPNDSVSWLAKDVVNNLQRLSDMARTRVMSNDIATELPPIGERL
nr:hypothetical protein [uncultured bacterium]